MDYEVQIWYESLKRARVESSEGVRRQARRLRAGRAQPENEGRGFDFVKFAEACGAKGERVTDPDQIKAAFKRGVDSGMPYVIDVILERETDCSMGVSIDAVREFE